MLLKFDWATWVEPHSIAWEAKSTQWRAKTTDIFYTFQRTCSAHSHDSSCHKLDPAYIALWHLVEWFYMWIPYMYILTDHFIRNTCAPAPSCNGHLNKIGQLKIGKMFNYPVDLGLCSWLTGLEPNAIFCSRLNIKVWCPFWNTFQLSMVIKSGYVSYCSLPVTSNNLSPLICQYQQGVCHASIRIHQKHLFPWLPWTTIPITSIHQHVHAHLCSNAHYIWIFVSYSGF